MAMLMGGNGVRGQPCRVQEKVERTTERKKRRTNVSGLPFFYSFEKQAETRNDTITDKPFRKRLSGYTDTILIRLPGLN